MKLTQEEKQKLENIYQVFLNDEKIKRMQSISMHRGSNCYEHSFKVAKFAMKIALRGNKKNLNLEALLIGAILHDYYLYDWRKDRSNKKKHSRKHPYLASENASKDFDISKEIKKIIETHMWPFNFKDFPNTKEARIVSIADKNVALCEALTSIAYKNKHRQKYLDYISTLFPIGKQMLYNCK